MRNGLKIVLVLAALYALLIILLYVLQRYLIFMPSALPADHIFRFDADFKELEIATDDGSRINGLYFNTTQVRKGVVLYFHGNAGNLQDWGQVSPLFTDRGYDLLIVDYRSYGKTAGPLGDEATFYRDGRRVYDWLRSRFAPEEIVIYGRSLGTAVASSLAAEVPARQLILETPFDNLKGVILDKAPFLWLPFPLSYQFPVDQFLRSVSCPAYVIQGTADQIVPLRIAEKLKPLLKNEEAFITIAGGGHNNLSSFEDYHRQLDILLGIDEE